MAGVIERAAHGSHIARDPGRSLVVTDQHCLDAAAPVRRERGLVTIDRRPLAPLGLEHLDLEAEPLAHVNPQMGELSEARRQHAVAGAEAVGECRFPTTGPGRRKQNGRSARRLEYLLETRQARERQLRKGARAMVLHWHGHRPQDPIRNIGRSRDEEKVTTGHKFSFLLA